MKSRLGADGLADQPLVGARARVARSLLTGGPATASAVAHQLGLTPTATRRTLDGLVEEGLATATDRPPFGPTPPRLRGRPARVYSLTSAGHDVFEKTYDDLAAELLRFIRSTAGDPAVGEFATQRAVGLERRYGAAVARGANLGERAELLAEMLTLDGYAADVAFADGGSIQICQHHCPIARVAAEFPTLCEAEAAAFARMLGAHVVRLATLARGDGVCTVSIPGAPGGERSAKAT